MDATTDGGETQRGTDGDRGRDTARGPDVEREGEAAPPVPPPVAIEARQRWRIVFARPEPDERTHREIAEPWTAALVASGLPLPRPAGRPRPPLAFAAPLPVGVGAAHELADLWLAERRPIADVRPVVEASVPTGIVVVDLFDVWLGAAPLAAALVAADWRVEVAGVTDPVGLAAACQSILAQPSLERDRPRGGGSVRYDLRPLLDDVAVASHGPVVLQIRTRFHPERGAGRPEEVVAALAEAAGQPLACGVMVRDRLILAGEA